MEPSKDTTCPGWAVPGLFLDHAWPWAPESYRFLEEETVRVPLPWGSFLLVPDLTGGEILWDEGYSDQTYHTSHTRGDRGGQGRPGKQKLMAAPDIISKIRLDAPGWSPRAPIFFNQLPN